MHMQGTILIVDDNVKLCESLKQNFESEGYRAIFAHNGRSAISVLQTQAVNAVLLDIMVGEESGIAILGDLRSINRLLPVIIITGHASVDSAVQSLKLGAIDYVKKPLKFDLLLKIVENAIRLSQLELENQDLKSRLGDLGPRVCGKSLVMTELVEKVKKLALSELPILIVGESGTGKELIADAVHAYSSRSTKRMLKVNCAAFPESLLDNELFGHDRGAYTGADSAFKGVFERADKSSLFLDEIGDMPVSIQAKILRTLQNREVRRIGGAETITVNVRFIAASNHKLEELICTGRFREDLYYRLNAALVKVPPLREHMEDLPELASLFAEEYAISSSMSKKWIPDDVMGRFMGYGWPGNVRELRNTVSYACAVSSGDAITAGDLPPSFGGHRETSSLLKVREAAEKDLILRTLRRLESNKKQTAEVLGMSRRTLYNKLAKYGVDASSF